MYRLYRVRGHRRARAGQGFHQVSRASQPPSPATLASSASAEGYVVGQDRLELSANGLRVPDQHAASDMPNGNSPATDTPTDTSAHEGPRDEGGGRATADNVAAQVDAVEAALADALQRAALAGAFDAVAAITAELKARREARANVVRLDDARAKRGTGRTP